MDLLIVGLFFYLLFYILFIKKSRSFFYGLLILLSAIIIFYGVGDIINNRTIMGNNIIKSSKSPQDSKWYFQFDIRYYGECGRWHVGRSFKSR